jgi:hypothetical protein
MLGMIEGTQVEHLRERLGASLVEDALPLSIVLMGMSIFGQLSPKLLTKMLTLSGFAKH